jgi:hypothetical protein
MSKANYNKLPGRIPQEIIDRAAKLDTASFATA